MRNSLLVMLTLFFGGLSAESALLNLSNLTSEVLTDFASAKLPELTIECSVGTKLPFQVALSGDFFALDQPEDNFIQIKAIKTLFIRCVGDYYLFSLDKDHWKSFEEFFKGNMGASFAITETGPEASLNLDLSERKTVQS